MNLIYIILFGIFLNVVFVLIYHFWKYNTIFAFGVAGALNANFFNIGTYPLMVGPLIFGLDSILYSFFIFMVIFTFLKYGKKPAYNLMYGAICAILLLAFIQFIASILVGDLTNFVWTIGSYLISALSTYLCIMAMIYFSEKIKNKGWNALINITLSMIIATIINSSIYFILTFALTGTLESNLSMSILGSFIAKFIAIILSCITYFILNKIDNSSSPTDY